MVTIHDMCDALSYAARYEGSELGEYWERLAELPARYSVNDEFHDAWVKEVTSEYNRLQTEFEWEEEERTVVQKVKELVYVG